MAKYKNEVNQYIKERVDIVDVISSAVDLKRAGRNHKGLCPFHSEKTPSFMVNSVSQYYHCFGCGESGDAISFVMKNENLEYLDALESLADRYNIDLSPMRDSDNNYKVSDKKPLYELMKESARHYFYNLQHCPQAQEYLKARGVSPQIAKRFGLGYAKDQWDDLLKTMTAKGVNEQQLLDCGLIVKNEKGRYYDRFRNRLIFPIFDIRKRVIAFGGRVLDDSLPKYLNSPETLIFHKSDVLYGLNFASRQRGEDTVFLVEGYMDVIAMHQYGFKNSVASLGTALTSSHVKTLDRIYDKLVFAYDSDSAGQKAIANSLEVLADSDLTVKILKFDEGKDPDEVLKKIGAKAFAERVESAENTIEFRLTYFAKEYDLSDSAERIKFLQKSYLEIATESPSLRKFSLDYLAELLDLSPSLIYEDFNDFVTDRQLTLGQASSTPSLASADVEKKLTRDKLYRAELMLLRKALVNRKDFLEVQAYYQQFYYAKLMQLWQDLEDYYQRREQFVVIEFSENVDLKVATFVDQLLKRENSIHSEKALKKLALTADYLQLEKEIKALDAEIKKLRLSAAAEDEAKLRSSLTELLSLKQKASQKSKSINSL